MRLVMLWLERRGAAEGFDRLVRLAEHHQRDGPVVVGRDESRIGPSASSKQPMAARCRPCAAMATPRLCVTAGSAGMMARAAR